jgi:hypothetical protein
LFATEDGCRDATSEQLPPLPDYIIGGSPREERVFARGPEAVGAFQRLGTGCTPVEIDLRGRLYRRGAEIPLASFAATREVVLETGGRLAVLARRSDDGALFRTGSWDTRRREPIATSAAADGAGLWLPARVAFAREIFHDPACTQQAASSPEVAEYALPLTAVAAGSRGIDDHEIGARVFGVYAFGADNRCTSADGELAHARVHKVGTVIPTSAFATSNVVEVGSGRLRALYRAGTDGTPLERVDADVGLPVGRFRDAARGELCSFSVTSSGIRCLPSPRDVPQHKDKDDPQFAGATDLILRVDRGAIPPATVTDRGTACRFGDPPEPVVYAVGEKFGSFASGSLAGDYYLLRDTVPLERFVVATLRQH